MCSDLEPTKAEAKRKAFGLAAGKIDSMLNKYAQEEGLEVSEIEKSLLSVARRWRENRGNEGYDGRIWN